MYCADCNTPVAECTCPDIDQRLKELSKTWAMLWCTTCDREATRCQCKKPEA